MVFRIEPGPNGMIEGGADDTITSRDLHLLGASDLEGIEYAPNGNLFVLPNKKNADILEIDWAGGTLVKAYDLSLARLRAPSRSPTGRRAPTARRRASTSPIAASTTMGIPGRTTAGSSSSASRGSR